MSTSWRMASRVDELRGMIHAHPAISFSHVRHDANKVADLLANVGVEGELAFQWGPLESFGDHAWVHNCRQLAAQDLTGGSQLTRLNDAVDIRDKRREHAMTDRVERTFSPSARKLSLRMHKERNNAH